MSSEQSLNSETVEDELITFVDKKEDISKKIETRVDINNLLVKLREKEKSQKQENLLFFGIFSSIVITIGIVATF